MRRKKKPCSCQNFTKILQTQRANNQIESGNTKKALKKKIRINNSFQNINYKDLYMSDKLFFNFFGDFYFWEFLDLKYLILTYSKDF